MHEAQGYGGIDRFRVVAALLIVAVHTSPLLDYSASADFVFTRVIARIAVPFFLMITGYFLLPQYLSQGLADRGPLLRFLKKIGLLYGLATVLYLPISIYAGQYASGSLAGDIMRKLLFDGTFYHLWYLPAAMIGVMLVWILGRKCSSNAVTAIAVFLYLIGLFGDSYYGISAQIPPLKAAYELGFSIFSYTRNGFFYAPIFLIMGARLAGSAHQYTRRVCLYGCFFSLLAMTCEGLLLHHFGLQRHDSMYLALLPCLFFLFRFLLTCKGAANQSLRSISVLIYLLHPLMLVLLRGAAKLAGLTALLVANSLLQYIAVCILSSVVAIGLTALWNQKRTSDFHMGRAWIELDMKNLRHNVKVLRSLLPDACQLMPAVKANAYGHGDVFICKELNRLGIRAFCVATVQEGVHLRRHGVKGDLLVLGYTHPKQFPLLKRYHLMQTVIDGQYAQTLNSFNRKISVHIKIDTGMHRLGVDYEQISELVSIFKCKNLLVKGIYTHLCVSDSVEQQDTLFTHLQIERFYEAIAALEQQGCSRPKLHIQGSSGVLNYPELSCDYARIGIALYGVLSRSEETCPVSLRPVLSVKARVELVRPLKCGEAIGYGLQFTAPQDMTIAVLAIGYADGIPRHLSCGVGHVLVRDKKAPILGRICMDQTLVDITDISAVCSGDVAVVLGVCGDDAITACDLADQADTISNEILSRLSDRLEKVHLRKA